MSATQSEHDAPLDPRIPTGLKLAAKDGLPHWTDGPTRSFTLALIEDYERLTRENARLRELGDALADAIKAQVEHGSPVSIVVTYTRSEWVKHSSHIQHGSAS